MVYEMKKKPLLIMICVILLITIGFVYDQTRAVGNDPGTIGDPLVTKSYVDELNAKLVAKIDQKLPATQPSGSGNTVPNNMTEIYKYIDDKLVQTQPTGYVVVEINAGQKLICEESTELILRTENANVIAIASAAGDGLTDITSGENIEGGETIMANHLIIIARTDGRGLLASKKSYIMVKGKYTVQ